MFRLDLIFEMKFINADQDEDTLSSIGELGICGKWKRTNKNCESVCDTVTDCDCETLCLCLWRINIYQAYNIIVICLQIKYFLQFKSDYEYFQIGAGVVKDKQDLQPAAKWEIGKSWRKNFWKVFWCTGSESNNPRGSLPAKNWIWNHFFFSTLWKFVGLVCWMEVVVTLS